MSCDVKNVVYVMKCRGCGEEYIGETGNPLRQRVTIHNQQIRDPKTRMLKVSEHIANCAHALNPNIIFSPFIRCIPRVQLYDGRKKSFLLIL